MITKFSTVYADHVDLGEMGQMATPANERRYSNEHLASVFAKTEAIARCMDAHGYNTLWLAEHHFQHKGYECLPNDVHLSNSMGSPKDVVLEQLAWLGKEVMPAFTAR